MRAELKYLGVLPIVTQKLLQSLMLTAAINTIFSEAF